MNKRDENTNFRIYFSELHCLYDCMKKKGYCDSLGVNLHTLMNESIFTVYVQTNSLNIFINNVLIIFSSYKVNR